jgi:hypothetical protein
MTLQRIEACRVKALRLQSEARAVDGQGLALLNAGFRSSGEAKRARARLLWEAAAYWEGRALHLEAELAEMQAIVRGAA